jgi:threonine/homoserine/homoserine lactone efflux protein
LFFLTFLAQFADPGTVNAALRLVALGLIFALLRLPIS